MAGSGDGGGHDGKRAKARGGKAHPVRVERVYGDHDQPGHHVLVDRLWPRGVAKAGAPFEEWCKDAAPSAELRKWYGHDPDRFGEFAQRYRAELGKAPTRDALEHLVDLAHDAPVVLLTATKDLEISGAKVCLLYTSARGG